MKLLFFFYSALCFFTAFVACKPTSRSSSVSSGKSNSRPASPIVPPPPPPAPPSPKKESSPPPPPGNNLRLPLRQGPPSPGPSPPKTPPQSPESKPGSNRPKLRLDTNVPPVSFQKPPPTPQTPIKPKVDPKAISDVRKNPGKPPNLVDTTSSFYNNNWPKPGQSSHNANDRLKTPGNTPISSRPTTPGTGGPQSPRPGAPGSPTYAQAAKNDKAAKAADAEEAARKKKIQALLDSGNHKPQRPDADWTPPPADKNSRKNGKGKPAYMPKPDAQTGRTPYHPNAASSGRIEVPPRQHQYSGQPGSPRNDPGFLQYSNFKDPYDRSYVRADRFKDKDGNDKVGATSVYDAKSMPYHAANKLNRLNQDPQMTYADAAAKAPKAPKGSGANQPTTPGGSNTQKAPKAKTAKDDNRTGALGGVMQTYDETRQNPKKTGPLANPRDEFPRAANEVNGIDGKPLKGAERLDATTRGPVPDRESRAEGKLTAATQRHAERLAQEQNEKNKKAGKPLQKPIEGTAVMDGDKMLFDHGNGRMAPWDGPAYQSPGRYSPVSPEAGPSNRRPRVGASPTSADREAIRNLQQADYDANFPSLPSSPSQRSRPQTPEMSKAEGKRPARRGSSDNERRSYRRDVEADLGPILRRWVVEQREAARVNVYRRHLSQVRRNYHDALAA